MNNRRLNLYIYTHMLHTFPTSSSAPLLNLPQHPTEHDNTNMIIDSKQKKRIRYLYFKVARERKKDKSKISR